LVENSNVNYVCFQAARAIEARAERLVYILYLLLFLFALRPHATI